MATVPRVSLLLVVLLRGCNALSLSNGNGSSPPPGAGVSLSRRDLAWKLPLGAAGTYVYGRLVYNALSVRDLKHPLEHEKRVESTILTSLLEAIPSSISRPLRVLEVGIGDDCRLLRRGLYTPAFQALNERGITKIEVTGVDIKLPKKEILEDCRTRTAKRLLNTGLSVDFDVIKGSIESRLPFVDGHFDAVISCLTLCSVVEPTSALQEMKRLLRPNGGTFAYIEHVAVEPDEPYRFLELQQNLLDPLQQKVADNCHLHRYTGKAIHSAFLGETPPQSLRLKDERFLVGNMWPVACQTCGVVQRMQ